MSKFLRACPFSGRLCKECPIYIGRHSQICLAAKYPDGARPKPSYGCAHLKFEFPKDILGDDVPMRDIEDREENIKEAIIVWKS
jgi:hypothetical protein